MHAVIFDIIFYLGCTTSVYPPRKVENISEILGSHVYAEHNNTRESELRFLEKLEQSFLPEFFIPNT